MIIEILNQKYKCGCNRGISKLEKPSILLSLNLIIDWNNSKFPIIENPDLTEEEREKLNNELKNLLISNSSIDEDNPQIKEIKDKLYIENKEFLGDIPELKPGNVFLFNDQVIAIDDESTLILIISPTGPGALDRIYSETIEPELKMLSNGGASVTWELLTDGIPEKYNKVFNPEYSIYKSWKDSFLNKNNIPTKGFIIEAELTSKNYIYPINFIMKDWKILYQEDQLEDDMVNDAVEELLSWFYTNK